MSIEIIYVIADFRVSSVTHQYIPPSSVLLIWCAENAGTSVQLLLLGELFYPLAHSCLTPTPSKYFNRGAKQWTLLHKYYRQETISYIVWFIDSIYIFYGTWHIQCENLINFNIWYYDGAYIIHEALYKSIQPTTNLIFNSQHWELYWEECKLKNKVLQLTTAWMSSWIEEKSNFHK